LVYTLKLKLLKQSNRANFNLIHKLIKSSKNFKYKHGIFFKTTPLSKLYRFNRSNFKTYFFKNSLRSRKLNIFESYFGLYSTFFTLSGLQTLNYRELPILDNFNISNHLNLPKLLEILKLHRYLISRLTVRIFPFLNFVNNYITPDSLSNDVVILNYRRRNFFPSISSFKMRTFVFSSLGLFSRKFLKSRSFIRSKALYLLSSSFLRKVLIYASFTNLLVYVKRKPLYLQEILSTLFSPVIAPYKHPFLNTTILENTIKTNFNITNFIFFNNKSYTYQKKRLRGRLKRRIMKRLVRSNNVLD